ncbi:MAG: acyltransferase family protein [Candidatus Helarchaeota archaeon]
MTEETRPKPKRKGGLQRLVSLDLIRGIAAFMMIQGHFIYNTVESHVPAPSFLITRIYANFWFTRLYFFISENFLYSLGWSMFFLIIGIGLAISINSQKRRKVTFKHRFIHILKRTGFFILVQYVFNIVSYGLLPPPPLDILILSGGNYPPSDILFYLNPITSFAYSNLILEIGIWSLVIFFLMELDFLQKYGENIPNLIRIGIVIFFGWFGFYVILMRGNMFVYILSGGIFGSILMKQLMQKQIKKIFKTFLYSGIIILGLGLPLHLFTLHEYYNSLIPVNYGDLLGSPGYIMYSVGVILILFAIFYWTIDIKRRGQCIKPFRPFVLLGNLTLTIYVAHYIALNQMLYTMGFNSYFYLPTGWIWNFALVIFVYIYAVYWKRYNFKYSLEWMVQKIR